MKVKTENFVQPCNHRSIDECNQALCGFAAEKTALNTLVDQFTEVMRKRLHEKYAKGWHGWDDEEFDVEEIRKRIYNNLMGNSDKDAIDVANLAAFWWNRI